MGKLGILFCCNCADRCGLWNFKERTGREVNWLIMATRIAAAMDGPACTLEKIKVFPYETGKSIPSC
jgi:hypothetical protein